jgi:glucose/arabinose dehydrogenase
MMKIWIRPLLPGIAVILLLGACSASDADRTPSEAGSPADTPTERSERNDEEASGRRDPAAFNPSSVRLGLEEVASGLEAPVGIVEAGDGSGRLYVVEQTGAIRLIEKGRLSPDVFVDLSDRITAGGEQGLLGLAFHPDFEQNGRLFVNYTDVNGDTVVSELRAPDGRSADPESERVLLQIDQPGPNHNGGQLVFGPDGYLFVATGDGGGISGEGNGQNLSTLLGKLLRIDVDARNAGAYGIPPDNPFANEPGARPEIWAYGLRNPWRFSFDDARETLWVADVGSTLFEEVNRVRADRGGLNYGWSRMEGRDCIRGNCRSGSTIQPITGYDHGVGCSVTGGYVYGGPERNLRGGYLFSDYCSGTIWGIAAEARGFVEPQKMLESGLSVTSFGLDESGELYLADIASGTVFRVTASAS